MTNSNLTPHVGMICTQIVGSDKYGSKVLEVKRNGKTVIVGHTIPKIGDIPTRVIKKTYTLRDNGRWILKGQHKNYTTLSLVLGKSEDYKDREF